MAVPLVPYAPSAPPLSPAEFSRAAWDEFYRIEAVLNQVLAPTFVLLADTVSLTLNNAPVYERLFDSAPVVEMEFPAGQAQLSTGILTPSVPGLYQVSAAVQIPVFFPSATDYVLIVRSTLSNPGLPDVVRTMQQGGNSKTEQRIEGTALVPIMQGGTLVTEAALVQSAGAPVSVVVNCVRSVRRVSGLS